MGAELAFEVLAIALESARGTPVTPPTHMLNMSGTITPKEVIYYPPDMIGLLAEYDRSEYIRRWCELKGAGGADPTKLPVIGNMVYAPLTTGRTAGGEVLTTTITAAGTGYTNGATVTVGAPAAGGRQAVITATVAGGIVTALTITDPGRGYTSAPTLTIVAVSGGSGATATCTVSALATIAKIWEFVRAMTVDNLKAATEYWGDPNLAVFQAAYGMLQQFVMSGDASSTNGVTNDVTGIGQVETELTGGSIPSMPGIVVGPLLVPGAMQLWMEPNTTDRFGKTAVSGRVVSAVHTENTGVVEKFVAVGPAGGVTFDHVGRAKAHPELKVVFEFADTTQYDLYANKQTVKARIRYNSTTAIESGFYPFCEYDIQGKLGAPNWGALSNTNRTIEFLIKGEYAAEIASDSRMRVQNSSASL